IHQEQNKVCGLTTPLKTKAASTDRHHRRGTPRSIKIGASAASHDSTSVATADSNGELKSGRYNNHAVCLLQHRLRNATLQLQDLLHHNPRICDSVVLFA